MIRLLFIVLGSAFIGLGFLAVFVPVLPTTPFLLLAAGCYVKSSDRLYSWLINHKLFGKYIRNFRENRSMPRSGKIISLSLMWTMIGLSVLVFIDILSLKIIIALLGVIGSVVILSIPTSGK